MLWRVSLGWTAEQHASMAQLFGIEEGAMAVSLVDKPPNLEPYKLVGLISPNAYAEKN